MQLLLLPLLAAAVLGDGPGIFPEDGTVQHMLDKYEMIERMLAKENVLASCVDPECNQDMYQMVTTKGYPCEQHVVTTSDGYELTIFRIPYGKSSPGNQKNGTKPVVFLQHGLLAASTDWVINFPKQSLGFLLADEGFDVWMGNVRGNTYGRHNTHLNPDGNAKQKAAFWGFSFDEMSMYDLPSMVEYALGVSKAENLAYVGHSQGTIIGFTHFSQQPAWAQSKINAFYALAPIAYMEHTKSPLRYIARFSESPILAKLLEQWVGLYEFLPRSSFNEYLCGLFHSSICSNILFIVAGYDKTNMNTTRLPVYASKSPAGTSTKNIIHFGQLITTGKFQAYDYGSASANEAHYGTRTPRQYHLNTMTVPTALYWGDTDEFADPTDVAIIQRDIQHLIESKKYADEDHLDFVWGLNAPAEVYPDVIKSLKKRHNMT